LPNAVELSNGGGVLLETGRRQFVTDDLNDFVKILVKREYS